MSVPSHAQDISFSSVPLILWRYYLEYLWFYDSSSWVARISSTLRVMAFLLILPLVILGMLDISSYVVARTLGVVDEVKASTTDKPLISRLTIPSIHVEDTSSSSTCSPTEESSSTSQDSSGATDETINMFAELGAAFDESLFSNEKLSGVGVFSPAASRASSPTLTRRSRVGKSRSYGGELNLLPEDFGTLSVRRRHRRGTLTGIQDGEK